MADLQGFHLHSCADARSDAPASDKWCSENCPRRLLAEHDRLRTAITEHRRTIIYQAQLAEDISAADERLWSVLEEPSDG